MPIQLNIISNLYILFFIIAVISTIVRFIKAKNDNEKRNTKNTKKPGKLQRVFDYLEKEFDPEQSRIPETKPNYQFPQNIKQAKPVSNFENKKKQKKAPVKEKTLVTNIKTERLLKSTDKIRKQTGKNNAFTANSHINNLSPLKKAIVLSEILSPPKALR